MVKYTNILILVILMAVVGCDSNERENVKGNPGLDTVEGDAHPTEEHYDSDAEISVYDRVSVIDNARLYRDPPEIKRPQGESETRYTEHPRWTFVRFVRASGDGYTELVITADGEERLANKEEWLPAYRVEPHEGDSIELLPDDGTSANGPKTAAPILERGVIVAVFPIKGPDGTIKVTDENGSIGYVYRDDLEPSGVER